MIQHLVQESLWPLPNTDNVHLSVVELSRIADKIKMGISSQILKKCKCASGKKGANRCQIEWPRFSLVTAHLELYQDARAEFLHDFSNREMATVPEN